MNGSIWLQVDDAIADEISMHSFCALGNTTDTITVQQAWQFEAILAINFEGLADKFVLESDVDQDDQLAKVGEWQVLYSPYVGREELISCLDHSFDGDFEHINQRVREYRDEEE
jgi:hypothetical protein